MEIQIYLLFFKIYGVTIDVENIRIKIINNLSQFRPAVMEEQGVGITLEEFNNRLDTGTLAGDVGFPESINMNLI